MRYKLKKITLILILLVGSLGFMTHDVLATTQIESSDTTQTEIDAFEQQIERSKKELSKMVYFTMFVVCIPALLFLLLLFFASTLTDWFKETKAQSKLENEFHLPIYKEIVFKGNLPNETYNNRLKELVSKETILFESESYQQLDESYKIPVHLEALKKRFGVYVEYSQEHHAKVYANVGFSTKEYVNALLTFSVLLYEYSGTAFDKGFKENQAKVLSNNYWKLKDKFVDSKQVQWLFDNSSLSKYSVLLFKEIHTDGLAQDTVLLTEIFNVLGNDKLLTDIVEFSNQLVQDYEELLLEKEKANATKQLQLKQAMSDYTKVSELD